MIRTCRLITFVGLLHTIFAIYVSYPLRASETLHSQFDTSSTLFTSEKGRQEKILNVKLNLIHNNRQLQLNIKAEGTSITAVDSGGRPLWSVKLPEDDSFPEENTPSNIRMMWLDKHNKIKVIQGKHTFYEVDPISGVTEFLGSD